MAGLWIPVMLQADGAAGDWSPRQITASVALVALATMGMLAVFWLVRFAQQFNRAGRMLEPIPSTPVPSGVFRSCFHYALGPVLPMMLGTSWEVMKEMVQAAMPIVRLRIGYRHVVIVGDAAGIKRIFQTKQRLYEKDTSFSYYPFMPILGTGLVTANGTLWQTQRLLIGPALRMDMLDEVVIISKEAVERLAVKLEQWRGTGQAVDMYEEFRLLTLQVIGKAILSLPPDECDKVFPQLYLPVMEESNQRVLQPWRCYMPTPAWWAFNSRISQLNSYITRILRARWTSRQGGVRATDHPDLLDRILSAVEERGEGWSVALETQLCYEVKTFLLAGHETSAAMLTWTLYELTQHRDCLAKMVAEATVVFGPDDQMPERQAVDEMDYTVSALKETLRKYTVVPVVVRQLSDDDELCGHRIPAGTTVIAQLQSVHSDGWQSPELWRPARFLPGGEYDQFDEDLRLFRFAPFIQGPRNCLGQYFALLEARIVIALLVKRFKFRTLRSDAGKTHPKVIPVGPLHGMPMIID